MFNCFLFSIILLFILTAIIKYCHYHFSDQALNKLSLRSLIWALVSLSLCLVRQTLLEFGVREMQFGFFKVVDRLTKLTAMILGMSVNYEKQILNLFIIF